MRITIEADSLGEFDAIIAHLAGSRTAPTAAPTKPSKDEAPRTPAPKETAKAETPKEETKAPAPKEETSEISYAKDIAPRVLKLAQKNRAKAEAVLKEFGVAKAPQLSADQYPAFIIAIDKVTAEVELA